MRPIITRHPHIDGAYVLDSNGVRRDERGHFIEAMRTDWPFLPPFVQQNESYSKGIVLRGLHFQRSNPQGKLVRCAFGAVRDVIFDLRKGSPSYLKGSAMHLDHTEGLALYVPPGVAHGFLTLTPEAVLIYHCTTFYDAATDAGVNWKSPELAGLWRLEGSPLVSPRDEQLPCIGTFLNAGMFTAAGPEIAAVPMPMRQVSGAVSAVAAAAAQVLQDPGLLQKALATTAAKAGNRP